MTEQPEALRLAAALDSDPSDITGHKAAAELRRLHSVNAQLLEALEQAEQVYAHLKMWPMLDVARAAIAAAKGEA
jgi:hypothetical protein